MLLALLFSGLVMAEFLPPQETLSPPPHFTQTLEAVGKIRTLDGARCTGFFISQTGYALTNLHCLRECLQSHQLIYNSDTSSEWGPLQPTDSS